jgi:hypothetical protein
VLSAVVLGILFRRVDFSWSAAVGEWTTTNTVWLGVAAALTAGSVVLSAWRWRRTLVAMDVPSRFGHLVSHYYACQFVSNLLPTTIGGDVLRISRLSREGPETHDAFASVTIERLTGWLVLPAISVAGFLLDSSLRSLGHATTVALVVDAVTLVGLVAILYAADHPRLGGRFADRADWKRFLGAVHLGVGKLRRHPAEAATVAIAGLAYQLTLVLAAAAAAAALGIDQIGVVTLMAFFPAVLMLQVLPISIGGLGVREGAFVLFLTPLGVSAQQAVALGLLVWVLNLLVSLIGLPPYLAGGSPRTVPEPV